MVHIWLPAETHRCLLEGLPGWARTRQLLAEAREMHHAAGIRRVSCEVPDALALLQVAERVYPESAPLIRIAIRKAGASVAGPRSAPASVADAIEQTRELYPEPEPRPLRRLASVHLLMFALQAFQQLDRLRDLVRRAL